MDIWVSNFEFHLRDFDFDFISALIATNLMQRIIKQGPSLRIAFLFLNSGLTINFVA